MCKSIVKQANKQKTNKCTRTQRKTNRNTNALAQKSIQEKQFKLRLKQGNICCIYLLILDFNELKTLGP